MKTGTYAIPDRGWRADACVIAEPTSLDVVPANGGALTFRLHVTGLAAHSSQRTAGVRLQETPEQTREIFELAVTAAAADDPWLRELPVRVQWWGAQCASSRTPDASPIVAAVSAAHESVTGWRPRRWGAPYGSDLRLMNDIGGVPTVQYGPGDVTLAHGPAESVPISEVLTAAETVGVLAMHFCGLA